MIINPDVNVEVDLLCDSCGKGIIKTDIYTSGCDVTIRVEACKDCSAATYDTGYTNGFDYGMKTVGDTINTQIEEGLKDFDFHKLFKKSDECDKICRALNCINGADYNQAQSILAELLQ